MKELCDSLLFSTQDRSEDCPEERVETLCLKQSYLNVKALTKYWLVDSLRVNTLQRLYESSIVLYKEFLHSTPHPEVVRLMLMVQGPRFESRGPGRKHTSYSQMELPPSPLCLQNTIDFFIHFKSMKLH